MISSMQQLIVDYKLLRGAVLAVVFCKVLKIGLSLRYHGMHGGGGDEGVRNPESGRIRSEKKGASPLSEIQ